jgi:hypothetical protein
MGRKTMMIAAGLISFSLMYAEAVAQIFTDADAIELHALGKRIAKHRIDDYNSYESKEIWFCLSFTENSLQWLDNQLDRIATLGLISNRMKVPGDTAIVNSYLRLQMEMSFFGLLPVERRSINFTAEACGSNADVVNQT